MDYQELLVEGGSSIIHSDRQMTFLTYACARRRVSARARLFGAWPLCVWHHMHLNCRESGTTRTTRLDFSRVDKCEAAVGAPALWGLAAFEWRKPSG